MGYIHIGKYGKRDNYDGRILQAGDSIPLCSLCKTNQVYITKGGTIMYYCKQCNREKSKSYARRKKEKQNDKSN